MLCSLLVYKLNLIVLSVTIILNVKLKKEHHDNHGI